MQNKSVVTKGMQETIYYDGSSTGPVVVTAQLDEVSEYQLVKGDKMKPNMFAYTASVRNSYRGEIIRFRPGYPAPFYSKTVGTVNNNLLHNISIDPEPRFNRLYNTALSRLYDKTRGSLDLSVAVAEMQQTKNMLASMHKFETYFKRQGSWSNSLRKSAGRNWLAAHLGWKPLLQDIYGAIDEFNNHVYTGGVMKISASASEDLQASEFPISGRAVGMPQYPSSVNGRVGVRFACNFEPGESFDIARWTSLNPLSIAWELMPYSFVVDYFYDIGSMLRSVETACLNSTKLFSGYYTSLFAGQFDDRLKGRYNVVSPVDYDYYDWTSSNKYVRFRRTPFNSAPLPRLPSFTVPTSWQKLVTMAALLSQHLR